MKIPTNFTIPDTIEGVAGLLTARKWEKAAIIYAWTQPQQGRRTSLKSEGSYSITDFAELGIAGLTSTNTVQAYRDAWVWAVEQDYAPMVGPGDEVDLEDLALIDFPPTTAAYSQPHALDADYKAEADAAGVTKDAVRRTAANKAALGAAIKADPAVAEVAREAITQRDAATRRRVVTDPHGKQESPMDQLVQLHVQLRSAKRTLTEALGFVIDMRGITDADEVRASVSGYVQQLRHVLDLIDEAAQGRSLDDELAVLLAEES